MATIMEALDKKLGNEHKSMTIMEALGGSVGEQIADNVTNDLEMNNPLLDLAIDFNIGGSVDLLGKVVGDLQEDMAVSGTKVTGTSHYVTGYTGFSGDPDQQEGNYVAIHASVGDLTIGTNVTVKANNVTMDPDGLHIMIFNPAKTTAKLILVASADGHKSVTKVYDFSAVVREAKEEEAEEA